jgi:recA bacterial DNA recombination protein
LQYTGTHHQRKYLIFKEIFMDMAVKGIAPNSEKAKALQAALAQIEKQFGKGTIMRLGEGPVDAWSKSMALNLPAKPRSLCK